MNLQTTITCLVIMFAAASCDVANSDDINSVPIGRLRFFQEFNKGCGENLNDKAVGLQEAGISQMISGLMGNGKAGRYGDYNLTVGGTEAFNDAHEKNQPIVEAAKVLEQAIALEPRLLPAYFALMDYYQGWNEARKTQLVTEISTHCTSAIMINHFQLIIPYNQVLIQQLMCDDNNLARMIKEGEAAIAKDPNSLDAYRILALAYSSRNQFAKAAEYAMKLKSISAQSANYKNFANEILADVQNNPQQRCTPQELSKLANTAANLIDKAKLVKP